MFDSLEEDSESLYPTKLDESRLLESSSGDTINGELNNWSVLVYDKSYVLLLNNSKKYNSYMEFADLQKLIYFLKKA